MCPCLAENQKCLMEADKIAMLLTNIFTILVLPSAIIFALTPIAVSVINNADDEKKFSEQIWVLPFTMR